jgi:hypothetical protein
VAPLRVTATLTRPGRKVRLVSTQVAAENGTVVATATVLGIRRADVVVPAPPADEPPPPSTSVDAATRGAVSTAVDHDGFHNVGVEHRFVRGRFEDTGPATDWIRLRGPVVDDEPVSPFQRVLAAADFGNGVSRLTDFDTTLFINPDLTVYLHRLPVGEWVCLDAVSRLEGHGIGLAESALWDEDGPLGRSLQSLLVEPRA